MVGGVNLETDWSDIPPSVSGSKALSAETFVEVLGAARLGAAWAFEVIYRSLAPSVVGYLRLQRVEDPEDLSSEVFVGIFRNLAGFDGDQSAFRSWVFAIAHRRVVDDHRRRARRPTSAELEVNAMDFAGSEDTEEEAMARLSRERVVSLCDHLSPDQRDVVLLRLLGDLSLEETASALGKSVGAVKALQHRAVACLRKELQREISIKGVSQ